MHPELHAMANARLDARPKEMAARAERKMIERSSKVAAHDFRCSHTPLAFEDEDANRIILVLSKTEAGVLQRIVDNYQMTPGVTPAQCRLIDLLWEQLVSIKRR